MKGRLGHQDGLEGGGAGIGAGERCSSKPEGGQRVRNRNGASEECWQTQPEGPSMALMPGRLAAGDGLP